MKLKKNECESKINRDDENDKELIVTINFASGF